VQPLFAASVTLAPLPNPNLLKPNAFAYDLVASLARLL
jgi:hypothetical protein